MTKSSSGASLRIIWIAYFATLLLLAAGILFPEQRIWGVSVWAHFPVSAAAATLIAAAIIPAVLMRLFGGARDRNNAKDRAYTYLYFCVGLAIVLGVGFYLLRVRIHFLGDGYTLINNLASDEPIVKLRNFGETVTHQLVYSFLSGDNIMRAVTAYRMVSIGGGVLLAIIVLVFARLLFEKTQDRVLFSLGLLSGGYMLLFFGYAEHYSLFVLAVALYGLVGLLVASGRLSRLWILAPFVLCVFMHIFGVILVPPTLYLLTSGTRFSAFLARRPLWMKVALIFVIAAGASVVFYHFYTTSYFFRFAFVPVVGDQFTVEGYTMFSLEHIADAGNLVFLLFPGVLVAALASASKRMRKNLRTAEYVFLNVFLLSCFGAIFVFDPKLGMPRDWDLFSFFGVPLVLFGFYSLVRSRQHFRGALAAAVLAVILGFVSLVPRVVSQSAFMIGLAQVCDYARLDLKKSLFLFQHLHEYYWKLGEYERSPLMYFDYDRHFPEYRLTMEALELKKQGDCRSLVPLLRQAIAHNPTFVPPYCNLGSCYVEMGFPDSALPLLRIADGLSPHRVQTKIDLGYAWLLYRKYDVAEEYFEQALDIDSDFMPAYERLLTLYSMTGDINKYESTLLEAAKRENASAQIHKLLGDYYLRHRDADRAREQYVIAIRKGLPPENITDIFKAFPDLLP